MRKILPVPFYSQHLVVKDPLWRLLSCGIVALKSVLDFLEVSTPPADELIRIGLLHNGHSDSGWTHAGLVSVAASFGVDMKRKEFRSEDPKEAEKLLHKGIDELVLSLEHDKPVLISAIKKWVETKKFHMMVLVGFEIDNGALKGFYYHDPDVCAEGEGKNQFVSIDTFKKHWRRMAIFVDF